MQNKDNTSKKPSRNRLKITESKKEAAYIERISKLESQVNELNHQLAMVYSSKKWRAGMQLAKLLSPLRIVVSAIKNVNVGTKSVKQNIISRLKPAAPNYPISLPNINLQYKTWIKNNELTKSKIKNHYKKIDKFKIKPKISIVVPTYRTPLPVLKETVESVRNQLYKNWELVIIDDGSNDKKLSKYISSLTLDPKIKTKLNKKNMGIVSSTNKAIKISTGRYIAFLDHDDKLTIDALFHVVSYINKFPQANWFYSDEDKIDTTGQRIDPYFKPNYSPYFLLSQMYTCHLAVYKKTFGETLGWLRKGYDGSQDYDLALRAAEKTEAIHIPLVLYHWRKMDGSTAQSQEEKPYTNNVSLTAIQDALKRRKVSAKAELGLQPGTFRVKYSVNNHAMVSIIIPTKNQVKLLRSCIESILNKTNYKNYEIIIIDNQSNEKKAINYLKSIDKNTRIRVKKYNHAFNFSAINNFGAKFAHGNYLLFLNNDIEVINADWLKSMIELAQQKNVAAVGAKLLYPSDTIQHAGVILGIGGIAGHSHKHIPEYFPGYFSQKDLIREYSAVTGGCLMVQKSKYEDVGGFDETYAVAFNDVDLCLRFREKGYLNLYTPYAQLYHYESISVGQPNSATRDRRRFNKETKLIRTRWGKLLKNDPYYNPNLTLEHEDSSLNI